MNCVLRTVYCELCTVNSGSVNLLEPSGPVQSCTGIALSVQTCTDIALSAQTCTDIALSVQTCTGIALTA